MVLTPLEHCDLESTPRTPPGTHYTSCVYLAPLSIFFTLVVINLLLLLLTGALEMLDLYLPLSSQTSTQPASWKEYCFVWERKTAYGKIPPQIWIWYFSVSWLITVYTLNCQDLQHRLLFLVRQDQQGTQEGFWRGEKGINRQHKNGREEGEMLASGV